ncbi:tetratricopeptide repeat protein, partial [Bacteroides caecimuris]|uniref:tetratricopeptide repeat protein n=1 Tax=Bacteroides caecimuris TaxID=1796613 RepID=UPI0026667D79
ANIMFLIQQANIRSSELKTAKEFNKEVANVNEAANKKISNIEVSSYASPDGGVSLNTTLAENRESNTTKMLNKDLKKAKIDAPVDAKYTAQDWEGFQELVSKSNIQDKELILRVLSMYQDPAQREQEIKNISSVYKTLADEILPQLRRSRLTLNYEIIGKSDEEISKLASSNPSELNVEELLYAATLTNDPAKQEAIYAQATKQFPNDYRAYNNLGKLAYQAGNYDKAESYFKKAASVNATPEVNMNLGLIALMKGDKAAAEASFGKAAGTKELGESMGNLYIAQGQYERAVNSFGDSKTNSAALAQILAKDYNKAKNTLANVERPDAYTDYLMAVLGARTNNSSMVTSSLKSAVAKESSLAKKAATDLEFAKFFTNADFMNIVK